MKLLTHTVQVLIVLLALIGYLQPASADVTVEKIIKSGGIAGIGAANITEKESFRGTTKRVESTREFTGKFLSKFSKPKTTTKIYRIDKKVIWELNHDRKTYTETPIKKSEEMKETQNGSENEQRVDDKEEQPKTKIIRNEFSVKDTKQKKEINGFPCRLYTVTWILEVEDLETGERSKSTMTSEFWNTKETAAIKKLKKAEETFNTAYMKALGLNMVPTDMARLGLQILGSVSDSAGKSLKNELKKLKGYSIVTSVVWESEGDKKTQKEAEVEEESSGGGLEGRFKGFLKKTLKKKDKKKKNKQNKVFESYMEIKSIKSSKLDASQFTVPAGFRKK